MSKAFASKIIKMYLYHVQPHEHSMLGHCEKTDGKIYNHSIMTGVITSQLKVNKGRPGVDEIALLVHTV
jgi:hypothetical protein